MRCIRGASQLSQSGFAVRYVIPENTLGQWEREQRTPPGYVVQLLAYAVYVDTVTGALDWVQE